MNRNANRIFTGIGFSGTLLAMTLLAGCPWDSSSSSTPAAPTLSGLANVTVAAGASGTASFTLSGAGTLSVTASSSNQTLLPDSGITGQGACTAAGSCTLTLQPAAGQSGGATVTVAVTDSRGRSATGSFVFTVNPPPQAQGTVGPAGGEVGFDDGRFKLTIPPGALTEDTDIVITELSGNDIPPELQDPSVQKVYRLEPDGLQFAVPATATIHTMGSAAPPDGTPVIGLVSDSEGTLELLNPLSNTVDDTGLTASAPISHFSSVAQVESKGFVLTGAVSPASVPVGGGFKVTVTLKQAPDSNANGSGFFGDDFTGPIYGSSFDPPEWTIMPATGEAETTTTATGTCSDVGTGVIFVRVGSNGVSGLFLAAIVGSSSVLDFALKVSVECTTPPPPPPAVEPGLFDTPGGLTDAEAIALIENLANLSGQKLAVFTGAEGYVVSDLVTHEVKRTKMSAAPLFGVAAISQDPPGPDSDAALFAFGQDSSFVDEYSATNGAFSGFVLTIQGTVTDAFPAGGTPNGGEIPYVNEFGVNFLAFNDQFGDYEPTEEVIPVSGAVSAFEQVAGGPVLVVTRDPTQGELFFAPRDGSPPLGIGPIGADSRRIRCSVPVCAVTNFAGDTLTIVLWDGMNMPTLIGTVAVGDGPVDLGLVQLGNGDVGIVSTGFNDNTYTETEVAPDGSVVSNTTTPAPDGCTQPAHAEYLTDSEGLKVIATCFDSANYFVALSTLGGG